MGTLVSTRDVVDALDSASDETSSYVNAVTGEVLTLTHEDLRLAEEEDDPEMPDWQQDAVSAARKVLESKDWLELPSKFDLHEWDLMDRFGGSLPQAQQVEVRNAIRGKGAFRSFKGTVRRLGVEDAWFAYKRRVLEDIAREWLAEHNLRPIDGAAQPGAEPDGSAPAG